MSDALAHAICPKLKPWMDAADAKPHPCKQCGPYDTNYGKALPLCLFEARRFAAAVAAHMESPEWVMRFKEALLCAIQADDGGAMIATENPWTGIDCHVQLDTVIRAAIRAAVGEGVG